MGLQDKDIDRVCCRRLIETVASDSSLSYRSDAANISHDVWIASENQRQRWHVESAAITTIDIRPIVPASYFLRPSAVSSVARSIDVACSRFDHARASVKLVGALANGEEKDVSGGVSETG